MRMRNIQRVSYLDFTSGALMYFVRDSGIGICVMLGSTVGINRGCLMFNALSQRLPLTEEQDMSKTTPSERDI